MQYSAMIKEIIKNIGGVDNVEAVTHCITRLRFTLKDDSKASIDGCKAIDGIVGCVNKNGQFQVVVGTHVGDVYDELVKTYHISEEGQTSKGNKNKEKMSLFAKLCDTMSGCVMPIVGPLAASGMIKALLVILTQFNIITTDTTTYQLLYMVADGVFYYLPVFLAFSSARKFNANPFLALIYGVMLVNPTYIELRAAGNPVTLFGLPVTMASYTSSVIPFFLIVYFQSKIEAIVKKFIPKAISIFAVPLVVSLITVPVGFVVLGPLGSIIGNYVAQIFTWMEGSVGWLVPVLVGGLCPLLVMTGMHYALGAAQSVQRASLGYATIMAPGMVCSNMAQAASSFGVALKTKNSNLKSLASSVGVSALCGITEPTLYGVGMVYKTPLYAAMAGGAIGGLWAGITGVKQWASGTSNIFSLPIYIGPDNSFMNIIIAVAIAMASAFVISFIIFKDPKEESVTKVETKSESLNKKSIVYAPINGKVIPLEEVKDEAFNSGSLGKGVGIMPEDGNVYAPVDGKITALFNSLHAIGLTSDDGMEVLVHIGLDTVKLNGKYFNAHVKQGDSVKKGDLLLTFDKEAIEKEGYDITTPVIITNSNDFLDVVETNETAIHANDVLLTGIR